MDIILISGKKNETRNFVIPAWLAAGTLVLFGLLIFLFIYNFTHFTSREIDRSRIYTLRRENRLISEELNRIEKEIANFNHQIDSLNRYDQKLRTFAPLKPVDYNQPDLGVARAGVKNDTSMAAAKDLPYLSRVLDDLVQRARYQSRSFNELLDHFDQQAYARTHLPSIIPVRGWFLSGFGYRLDPFTGLIKMHEGIDIAAPIGTPIVAPADGSVLSVSEKSGFGITVEIDHGLGLRTFFGHLQRVVVEPGAGVKRGDIIGYVGVSGKSTGPHLHYEVRRDGKAIDPIHFIITDSRIID